MSTKAKPGDKKYEVLLVIVVGCIFLSMIYKNDNGIYNKGFIIAGFLIGALSLAIKPLRKLIVFLWFKLADLLGMIIPKIVLGSVFYFFLFPISLVYRLFKKDVMVLKKKSEGSYFTVRNHKYQSSDFDKLH